MDILSHALWPIAIGKLIIDNTKLKFNLKWAGFFGAFPDLFAFTLLFIVLFFTKGIAHPPDHGANQFPWLHALTESLYSFTHSLIVVFLLILVLWIAFPKRYYALGGWLFHILVDIPTHTKSFYPTPFLWPLSSFTLSGFRWGQKWFIITNYVLLMMVLVYAFRKEIKRKISKG